MPNSGNSVNFEKFEFYRSVVLSSSNTKYSVETNRTKSLKMGGYMSKEWSEVVTGSSPGSPNDPQVERVTENIDGEIARRRILRVDPRSISDDVTRTPIQVDRTPANESTPKASAPAFLDPRSPSHDLPRTPIAVNPGKNPLNLDDSFEIESAKQPVKVPNRGAVAAELKEIEQKIFNVKISNEYEKEEGEITHDSFEENTTHEISDTEPIVEKSKVETLKMTPREPQVDYEKEEGEITHDSDDENVENQVTSVPANKIFQTPLRSGKSSLESDCRSPLLIENDEPVFDKLLKSELEAMASRNSNPRQRKPLGSLVNAVDDSIVI